MIRNKGFTLIELMIVIAILGILLAIAIPAYQDYTVRTRTSECYNLQTPVKLQVSEFYISNGSMPPDTDVAVNRTTRYCNAGTYARNNRDQGTLTINVNGTGVSAPGNNDFQGRMTGYGCRNENGDVEWTCHRDGATDPYNGRFSPASCRNAADPGRGPNCSA